MEVKMSDLEKKKSRNRNALVHGLHAKDVLLPWDSKEDFEILHQELRAEFLPQGRAQEETVLDLANALWTKHTLWRMRRAALLKDPFTADIVGTERKSWSGIGKELRAQAMNARSFQNLSKTVFTDLSSAVQSVQREILQASDRDEIKKLEERLAAFIRLLDQAAPFFQHMMQAPNAEKTFENAYLPESLQKMVQLEAQLDARIAKILARLVGLQEYKRTTAGGAAPQLVLETRR